MRKVGEQTKYPGVSRIASKTYQVRGKVIDPRTGKPKEVDRTIENVTLLQAVRIRATLLEELRVQGTEIRARRLRVGEYAQLWMKSKAVKIEPHTADYYTQVLDQHILPALGNYYYDALTRRDVQEWVNRCLTGQWGPEGKKRRPYKLRTVRGWYRVLHNMSRDAMEELGLERDPTMRVAFPDQPPATEPKSLRPDELSRFLAEVRAQYPQHYALTATLAFTGLRFCHASALKWEDWTTRRACSGCSASKSTAWWARSHAASLVPGCVPSGLSWRTCCASIDVPCCASSIGALPKAGCSLRARERQPGETRSPGRGTPASSPPASSSGSRSTARATRSPT